MVQRLAMSATDLGVLVAAATFAVAAFIYALNAGRGWQRIKSDVYYIRRDLDQILKLYRLTPAEDRDRKRRR